MTVTRLGSAGTLGGSTSSFVTAFGQTPTVGNLLFLSIMVYKSSSAPTVTTPTGWNLATSSTTNSSTTYIGTFLYWKVATASETAPSVTLSSTSWRYILEEFTGFTGTPSLDAVSVARNSTSTATAGNIDSNPVTTTGTDFVISVTSARFGANPSTLTYTWGGGTTADFAPGTNKNEIGSGIQSTTMAETLTPTNAYSVAGTTPIVMQTISVAVTMTISYDSSKFMVFF